MVLGGVMVLGGIMALGGVMVLGGIMVFGGITQRHSALCHGGVGLKQGASTTVSRGVAASHWKRRVCTSQWGGAQCMKPHSNAAHDACTSVKRAQRLSLSGTLTKRGSLLLAKSRVVGRFILKTNLQIFGEEK